MLVVNFAFVIKIVEQIVIHKVRSKELLPFQKLMFAYQSYSAKDPSKLMLSVIMVTRQSLFLTAMVNLYFHLFLID